MDAILDIEVEATDPVHYQLSWRPTFTEQPVTVFGGLTPNLIDFSTPLATTNRATQLRVPIPDRRWYFHLKPASENGITVAQRDVPLAGGTNFRDLGGYACDDGRRVQWGRVFRSGHLLHLTEAGKTVFAGLGIQTVCDFRLSEERQHENAVLPNAPMIETLGIAPGRNDRFYLHRLFASTENPLLIVDAVHEMVRAFVLECAGHYTRMFEVLLASPPHGILLNCSAGKERTGVGAALLLLALGVPRATVRYDFMLSGRYFPVTAEIDRVIQKYSVKLPDRDQAAALIMPLLETRESYADCIFDAIDAEYGSDTHYLHRAIGLNESQLARLRDIYTA
jgi:protein-tyrosine phosphatase